MKKKLITVLVVLVISSSTALSVFAFPGVPFDGSASAQGIDIDLNLLTANVGISVIAETSNSAGASSDPVSTIGTGNGVNVQVNTGVLPGVEVDLVNAQTTKTYDGDMTIMEDESMLFNINEITSPLVTTGIISSTSNSQVTGLVGWSTTRGAVTDARILGGIGTDPIVTVLDIYNWSTAQTTPENSLYTSGESVLTDVDINIPTALFGVISLVTVDVITSTVTAVSDGTMANADAAADVEFLNLAIDGTSIPTPTVNDVYVITRGAIPQEIARVTIMPIMNTTIGATNSSAEAVSLFIEILAGPVAGTEIYLAHSQAESFAEQTPSGPTSIVFRDGISTSTTYPTALPILLGFMTILSIATAVIVTKQKASYRLISQSKSN